MLWIFLAVVLARGEEQESAAQGFPEDFNPGEVYFFDAPLNRSQQAQARTFGNPKVDFAKCAIVVPEDFDPARHWTIILVHTTRDLHASNLVSLYDYIEPAMLAGCLVLASDGPTRPERDSIYWRWAMKGASLDYLHSLWPNSRGWTIIPSGYSGGAKMAAQYAAILMGTGYDIGGVYMGGCNEDFASPNRRRARKQKDAFLNVPMFLCLGEQDRIAMPEQVYAVGERLRNTGFRQVRIETHPGGHLFQKTTFALALDWFKELHHDEKNGGE